MSLKLLSKINFIALIVSYFYFSNLKIFLSVPWHIFFLTVGALLSLGSFKYVLRLIDRRVILLYILMFVVMFKSYLIYPGDSLLHNLSKQIIPAAMILFYVFSLVKSEKDMVFFEKVIVYVSVFSIVVAIFQYLQFDFAWIMRSLIGFSSDPNDLITVQIMQRNRPGGLAYYSITYSYQMLIVASLFFARYIQRPGKGTILLLSFVLIGLFVSLTRSSFFGFAFATFIYILYFNFTLRKLLAFTALGSVIGILIFMQDLRNFSAVSDISRYYLFLSAFNVFVDFIVSGVGGQDYTHLTRPYLENYMVPEWVANLSVHNSWLSALMKHGVFMLIVIIYFYFIYFKNIKFIKPHNSYLHVFFYVYILSYSFHSFFHNAGIFNGDQLFWIIFAYLLAVKNIYKRKMFCDHGAKEEHA